MRKNRKDGRVLRQQLEALSRSRSRRNCREKMGKASFVKESLEISKTP